MTTFEKNLKVKLKIENEPYTLHFWIELYTLGYIADTKLYTLELLGYLTIHSWIHCGYILYTLGYIVDTDYTLLDTMWIQTIHHGVHWG